MNKLCYKSALSLSAIIPGMIFAVTQSSGAIVHKSTPKHPAVLQHAKVDKPIKAHLHISAFHHKAEILKKSMLASSKKPASNASNYKIPFQLSVNQRTGSVTMNYTLNTIPGITSDVNIKLGLLFTGYHTISHFLGLPYGWTYQLDYLSVDPVTQRLSLHLASGQSYQVDLDDPANTSGLLYYKLQNMVFSEDKTSHQYILKTLNGAMEVFSERGLPLTKSDPYGNKIIYHYDDNQVDVYSTKLTSIETMSNDGKFDQSITVGYDGLNIIYTYPDGTKTTLLSFGGDLREITDALGDQIDIDSSALSNGYYTHVYATWPNGLVKHVLFNNNILYGNSRQHQSIPAVSDVVVFPLSTGSTPEITSYHYATGANGHNYTGYPDFPSEATAGFEDPLMQESSEPVYHYTVTVQAPSGMSQSYTYNKFHLQSSAITTDAKGFAVSQNHNVYGCQDPTSSTCFVGMSPMNYNKLPANYQTPSIVQSTTYGADHQSTRVHQAKTQFNDYGLPTAIYEYDKKTGSDALLSSNAENTFTLVKVTKMHYDLPTKTALLGADSGHYGALLQKDVYDCKTNTLTEQQNILTSNHLATKISENGMLHIASNGNICANDANLAAVNMDFSKESVNQYDQYGRPTVSTLQWTSTALSAQRGPASSTKSISYSYDPTTHLMTSTECHVEADGTKDLCQATVVDMQNGEKLKEMSECTNGEPLSKCAMTTTYSYDKLGRVKTEISPSGMEYSYSYENYQKDGVNMVSKRGPFNASIQGAALQAPTSYEYTDGLGNKLKEATNVAPDGSILAAGKVNVLKTYSYCKDNTNGCVIGKLEKETDLYGNYSTVQYNARGLKANQSTTELTSQTPQKSTQSVAYNYIDQYQQLYSNGTLQSQVFYDDQQNKTKEISYVQKKKGALLSDTPDDVTINSYDAKGNVINSTLV